MKLITFFAEAEHFRGMFFTFEVWMMYALMRRSKLFNRLAFFANQKTVIFIWFVTCTSAPFSKSWDMMDEFLCSQKIEDAVDRDGIYCEPVCDFIRCESVVVFFEKGEYFLPCFCLSHRRHCSNKISNATLLQ